jgi:putative addiction module killer protein
VDSTTAKPNVEVGDLSKAKLNTGPTTAMAMASYNKACRTRRVLGDMVRNQMRWPRKDTSTRAINGSTAPKPLIITYVVFRITVKCCEQLITITMYTIKRMAKFDEWLASLRDGVTRIRLTRRLEKVQRGLLGDVAPVGEGVSEMREFFGPGWRMYYVERDGMLIVMLGGGDKSTQSDDIARAIALSRTITE